MSIASNYQNSVKRDLYQCQLSNQDFRASITLKADKNRLRLREKKMVPNCTCIIATTDVLILCRKWSSDRTITIHFDSITYQHFDVNWRA